MTGIILSGGQSSRMGQDKGLMNFQGKKMIEYVIETLEPITNSLIIISNQEGYDQFGYPVYEDEVKGKGPLAGLCSGIKRSNTEINLVSSCDTPFITEDLYSYLLSLHENYDAVVPESNGKVHRLNGIYKRSCLNVFEHQLYRGRNKMGDALAAVKTLVADANNFHSHIFQNFNSPDELKKYL